MSILLQSCSGARQPHSRPVGAGHEGRAGRGLRQGGLGPHAAWSRHCLSQGAAKISVNPSKRPARVGSWPHFTDKGPAPEFLSWQVEPTEGPLKPSHGSHERPLRCPRELKMSASETHGLSGSTAVWTPGPTLGPAAACLNRVRAPRDLASSSGPSKEAQPHAYWHPRCALRD